MAHSSQLNLRFEFLQLSAHLERAMSIFEGFKDRDQCRARPGPKGADRPHLRSDRRGPDRPAEAGRLRTDVPEVAGEDGGSREAIKIKSHSESHIVELDQGSRGQVFPSDLDLALSWTDLQQRRLLSH